MKFCEVCAAEIATNDGENRCAKCEHLDRDDRPAARAARVKIKRERRMRESALSSLGLLKVRGALGGVYWE